jgi:hypothetical protein
MTWSAVGQVLPQAIAITISPLGIALVVLTLMSSRARLSGPLFAVGWFLGVTALTTVSFLLADVADVATDDSTGTGVDLLQIGLGVLFFFIAFRAWQGRPRDGVPASEPKLLTTVTTLSPARVAGLGVASASANFKTVPLAIGAGAQLAQTMGGDGSPVAALAAFGLLSSLAVIVPVVAALVAGDRAQAPLASLKTWLVANMATITVVIFVLMGANSVGQGLPAFG